MSDTQSEAEQTNAGYKAVMQKSKLVVLDLLKQIESLMKQLEVSKREIPALHQAVEEAKRKRESVEAEAEIELEKLFPGKRIFIASDTPEKISSHFSNTFLRSYKLSDNSFSILEYPLNSKGSEQVINGNKSEAKKPTEESQVSVPNPSEREDNAHTMPSEKKAVNAIRKLFVEALHSQAPMSDSNILRLHTPFSLSEISIYRHRIFSLLFTTR